MKVSTSALGSYGAVRTADSALGKLLNNGHISSQGPQITGLQKNSLSMDELDSWKVGKLESRGTSVEADDSCRLKEESELKSATHIKGQLLNSVEY